MSEAEAFTLITASSKHKIYDNYEETTSGHYADMDASLQKAFRQQYPELNLTVALAGNVSLLLFAAGGNAIAELDIENEGVKRFRYFLAGDQRRGVPDRLAEGRSFAKYKYVWGTEYFIVYVVQIGMNTIQYILKEPGQGETTLSRNSVTDGLIDTVGKWQKPKDYNFVYVFDGYWTLSREMYEEIQKATWDKVILDEDMKKSLTELMHKFFNNEDVYKDLGVPWKRGVIFHGPAGNGKTISIKALMHSLFQKYGYRVPSLYVKSAPQTYNIRQVFLQARRLAPCLLIFEDIDTIVTPSTRSYFFNEVDGLENNDGLFMVASTNHLDQLDPGLSERPSRFDRKYLFPLPSEPERVLYCEFWRERLKDKPKIAFPKKLCLAIAGITDGFSYAYLQEAFVSTLLVIAGHRAEEAIGGGGGGNDDDDDDNDLDKYELWREIKKQIEQLRRDMGNRRVPEETSASALRTGNFGESSCVYAAATQPLHAAQPATQPSSDLSNLGKERSVTFATGQPVYSSQTFGSGAGWGGESTTPAAHAVRGGGGTRLDCDGHGAPLMTDEGMFMDSSRFDALQLDGE